MRKSNKKYEMFGELDKHGLRRIRSLRNFGTIRRGDIGGYIESENNLSHDGNCWISGVAKVYGARARIYDNAMVSGVSEVCENALIYQDAMVWGRAKVYGAAKIFGRARIFGIAEIYGKTEVSGSAFVSRGNQMSFGASKGPKFCPLCGLPHRSYMVITACPSLFHKYQTKAVENESFGLRFTKMLFYKFYKYWRKEQWQYD